MKQWFLFITLGFLIFTCNFSLTNSIVLEEGQITSKSQSTVNGGIYIGKKCQVEGDCRSMNGKIKIGAESQVRDIQAVNGEIFVESFSLVTGSIKTVNGAVYCEKGVQIQGNLATLHGPVRCEQVTVHGDIITCRGDISLSNKSIINGSIIVRNISPGDNSMQPTQIVLKHGSVIKGDIIVEDSDLKTVILLSDDSCVLGQIKHAEVQVFSG